MNDTLALDRSPSVRSKDNFGRLYVATNNISKANVCPYRGNEIPGCQRLGLDPERVYQMYRAPEELAKAAATANNLPLLSAHVPHSAEDSQKDRVVGSTGTDAVFEAPHLRNSLVVWDQEGIDAVESGRARELSCAYSYEPDMTPGKTPDGVPYDGIMRNIRFNHVALVPDGRAGDDVVVGDAALDYVPSDDELERLEIALEQESNRVSNQGGALKAYLSKQSPRAAAVRGALTAYMAPLLAQDQRMPDLVPVVAGVNSKNYAASKKAIAERFVKLAKGVKLAKDADLKDVHGLLDRLDGKPGEEKEEREIPMKPKVPGDEETDPEETNIGAHEDPEAGMEYGCDSDVMERLREFLADKLSPEDVDAIEAMLRPAEATVEGEEAEEGRKQEVMSGEDQGVANFGGKRAPLPRDRRMGGRDKQPKAMDKQAMDAAISRAVQETEKRTIGRMNAIHAAVRDVRPYAGEVDAMAFDSAEAVYRFALENNNVDVKGVHGSALKSLMEILKVRGEASAKPARLHLASDSGEQAEGFSKRWPGADRVRNMG